MTGRDTSLGGSGRWFPDTTLGLLSKIRGADDAALDELVRRYWKPVYCYLRVAWSKRNEDAKDLTQDFFTWLMQGGAVGKYNPDRGSFHRYLRAVLRGYLSDHRKAAGRLKRGGGVKILSLADEIAPLENFLADEKATDPEVAFQKAWARSLARESIDRVRDRFREAGKESVFLAYEKYDLAAGTDRPTYADIARELGIKETDVANHLFTVREAIRENLQAQLALSVGRSSQLQEEWNELLEYL